MTYEGWCNIQIAFLVTYTVLILISYSLWYKLRIIIMCIYFEIIIIATCALYNALTFTL